MCETRQFCSSECKCATTFSTRPAGSGEKYEVADGFQWIVDFMRTVAASGQPAISRATQYVWKVSDEKRMETNTPITCPVIGDGRHIFQSAKSDLTCGVTRVIGEPDYGAIANTLSTGFFPAVVRDFTEDRKYLTDTSSEPHPGLCP